MCGIAGVIAWEDKYRVDRALLGRMSARVAHRGPDADAIWISHENEVSRDRPQAGLAFRRLAVIDLDPRAMQPMTDGSRWITFNGEIYNYRELRREIDSIRPGYPWKTTGDTEVILRAYDVWGDDCVRHFNGMFAFALWDPSANALFLARDRMGQKPLYYAKAPGDGAVAFASELPALRELSWLDTRVFGLGLRCYLEWGMLPMGMSIYWGADKLPPATTVKFTAKGKPSGGIYFDVNAMDGKSAAAALAAEALSTGAASRGAAAVIEALDGAAAAEIGGGGAITTNAVGDESGAAGDVASANASAVGGWPGDSISPALGAPRVGIGSAAGSFFDPRGAAASHFTAESNSTTGPNAATGSTLAGSNVAGSNASVRSDAPAGSNGLDDASALPHDAAGARRVVIEAVRRQLASDVPLGCFLSGGIDSSVIAAAMKASVPAGQPVHTFSIGFDDPMYDETKYARAVAEHLGTTHRQFTVRPDAAADLPKLAAQFGEPFADSSALPTHYLARETRKYVTVALSGDGGDELFGGYERYQAMRLGAAALMLPSVLRSLVARLPGTHPKGRSARLKRFVHSLNLAPAERYASYLRLFSEQQVAALVPLSGARVLRAETRDLATTLFERLAPGRDIVQTALAVDRVFYLPDDPLVKVDRASMMHGLEVRSPMLDTDVIQFAAGLTTDQLIGGGPKRMLREAFAADLPKVVFTRKKMGFAAPIGSWLRTTLKPMVHDLVLSSDAFSAGYFDRRTIEQMMQEHETFRADHSQRLYALLMLELWWRSAK